MIQDNTLRIALERAKKYPDDKAIQSLVTNLETRRLTAQTAASTAMMYDPFSSYLEGIKGTDGHYPLYHPSGNELKRHLNCVHEIHGVSVVADCLILALIALGEDILY